MRPSSVARGGSAKGARSSEGVAMSPPTSIATKSRPAWPQAASSGFGASVPLASASRYASSSAGV